MLYDTIIIGKGPAGITAGLYIKRAGFNVLVIGKDGGALEKTEAIDNYYGFENTISGKELLLNGLNQAKRLGIQVETDEVIGLEYENNFKVKTKNNIFTSRTLIIATGSNRKTPKLKGIKEYEGKGISYCAICDAFFYRGKDVSVLGSGDYALSEANELLNTAKSVTILTNGEELVQNRSYNYDKINILEQEIQEFRGNEKIEEVVFKDNSRNKNIRCICSNRNSI